MNVYNAVENKAFGFLTDPVWHPVLFVFTSETWLLSFYLKVGNKFIGLSATTNIMLLHYYFQL